MILSQSTHNTLPDRGSCAGGVVGQVWGEAGGKTERGERWGGMWPRVQPGKQQTQVPRPRTRRAVGGGRSQGVCSFGRVGDGLLYLRMEWFLSEVRLCFRDPEQPSWKSVGERGVLAGGIITNIG